MKLYILMACCAFMVVANVNAAVYVKGGSRYPFPRPDQSKTAALPKVSGNNKQSSHAGNRRYQREALNSHGVIEDTSKPEFSLNHPAPQIQQRPSISSPPTLSAVADNRKQTNVEFEDQRPIDFDLNVRTAAQFVPGLKSVSN